MSIGDTLLAQANTTSVTTAAGTGISPAAAHVDAGWNPLYLHIGTFAVFILLVFGGLYLLERQLKRYVKNVEHRRSIRRGSNFAGIILILLVAAFTFSSNLTGLTVSLGVAGAAVAFALQKVLSSAVAWLQITIGHLYRTGDRVKMGGVVGDVIHINVFLTTLMEVGGDWVKGDQYSGRIVRVPNAAIYDQPIYNYSSEYEYVWDEFTVPIKYGSDRKLIEKILHETAAAITHEATAAMQLHWETLKESYAVDDAVLEPQIFLVATDNWLEYSVRYLVHYKRRRSTKSELFHGILAGIDANPDKLGIASGTYDIVGLPQIKIDLGAGTLKGIKS